MIATGFFMFVVLLFFSGLRNTEILFLAFILSDGKLSGMFFSYGLRSVSYTHLTLPTKLEV
mgnify:CR=1 FL=1